MSISTALLWLISIGLLALMFALVALWRRTVQLSAQIAALAGKQSAPDLGLESYPSLQRGAAGSSNAEPFSDEGAAAQFPLITDKPAHVEGASAPRDPDMTAARVASVTLSEPLIKVAAFTHGVRRALDEEQRMRMSATFRRELRRQRKLRRRQRASRARAEAPRP